MKKSVLLSIILLSACAETQNIFSYQKIDPKQKTVSISAANLSEMHQALKQSLINSGYKLYVKNDTKDSGYAKRTSRYELSDNIVRRAGGGCGALGFQDSYYYAVSFVDLKTSEEVFSMQGNDCYENIVNNFNALINNRYNGNPYGEYHQEPTKEPPATPVLQIGGLPLWSK